MSKLKLVPLDLVSMSRYHNGFWYPEAGTPCAKYLTEGGYPLPSEKFPHTLSRPLLTAKFAKWLKVNHPETAALYGLE